MYWGERQLQKIFASIWNKLMKNMYSQARPRQWGEGPPSPLPSQGLPPPALSRQILQKIFCCISLGFASISLFSFSFRLFYLVLLSIWRKTCKTLVKTTKTKRNATQPREIYKMTKFGGSVGGCGKGGSPWLGLAWLGLELGTPPPPSLLPGLAWPWVPVHSQYPNVVKN